MNQVPLMATPLSLIVSADAGSTAPGVKSGVSAPDADLFRTALAASVAPRPAAAAAGASARASDVSTTQPAIESQINTLTQAGASQADVIAALSKQLAATVAQTLGTPGSDARGKLQTVFATALAPPGGESESVADLAQRYLRLAKAASEIANQQLGQQKRIAGNILDAQVAKEIPARITTTQTPAAAATRTTAGAGSTGLPTAGSVGVQLPFGVQPSTLVTPATNLMANGSVFSADMPLGPIGLSPGNAEPNRSTTKVVAGPTRAVASSIATHSLDTVMDAAQALPGRQLRVSQHAVAAATSAAIPVRSAVAVAVFSAPPAGAAVPAASSAIIGDETSSKTNGNTAATGISTQPLAVAVQTVAPTDASASVLASSDSAILATASSGLSDSRSTPSDPRSTLTDPRSALGDPTSALAATAVSNVAVPTIAIAGSAANADVLAAKRGAKTLTPATASASVNSDLTSRAASLGSVPAVVASVKNAGKQTATSSPSIAPKVNSSAATALAAITTGSGDGDGRTVNLGSKAATQTGGDTSLGRTLTRAALAADAQTALGASAAPASGSSTGVGASNAVTPSITGVASSSAAASSAVSTTTSAGAASSAGATNSAGSVASNDVPADPAIAAFTKAFQSAMKTGLPVDVALTTQQNLQATALLPLPTHEGANASAAFAPSVAPFTIDRADSTPAAAAASAPAPVDHSAIADQVLRGAFMRNVGQSSEMRLTLVPDSLGDVSVKLVVEAGSVTAHVVAQTPEVRDALVAAQPQLTKSLAESGLKLTSFTVDLQGGGFAGFSQQNDQSQNGSRSHRSTNSADVDDDGDDTLIEAIPSFGPSSITKPGAGDYNYLA